MQMITYHKFKNWAFSIKVRLISQRAKKNVAVSFARIWPRIRALQHKMNEVKHVKPTTTDKTRMELLVSAVSSEGAELAEVGQL